MFAAPSFGCSAAQPEALIGTASPRMASSREAYAGGNRRSIFRASVFKKATVVPENLRHTSTSDASGLDNLVREFLREERVPTPWYIIVPEGRGRVVWDAAMLLLILASAVSIPGQLAFSGLMDADFSAGLTHFHSVLLALYGLDLVLWCFVSFQEDSGEWAIALRCAQFDLGDGGSTDIPVTAYAGAGIVAGSDPESELIETRVKFRPIVDALA